MKKSIKVIIIVTIIFVLFVISIAGAFKLGYTCGYSMMKKRYIQTQVDKVEAFFEKNGYEISIMGANANGREHSVPFLYEWNWKCFEIGAEVIVLYYYEENDEINGYLDELDEERRSKCNISEYFVFYYDGEDEDIINIIREFCEFT